MKVRWNPGQQRFPALTGKLVAQTFRGQIHVQKWPRKRGPSKLAKQRRQVKWFSDANALAKRLWPDQIKLAMIMTKGTGLYPRDLLIRQMSGGIYDLFTDDGVHYQPTSMPREAVMFQGAILELDVDQVIPVSTEHKIVWPLPVLDTMGFWSVANPTRLTIPEGVEVVEVIASWVASNPPLDVTTIIRTRKNDGFNSNLGADNLANPTGPTTRGPQVVVAGDFFEMIAFTTKALNALGNGRTTLTLNVLQVVL